MTDITDPATDITDPATEKSAYLRLKAGSSDKTYNIHLRADDTGWTVTAENGRTGGPLKPQPKVSGVDYDKAVKEFDKLVKAKTAKGYSPGESGTAYEGTEHQGDVTGFQPQLLNDATLDEAAGLVENDPGLWITQRKHDGERRYIRVADGEITGANRRGLRVGLSAEIAEAIREMMGRGLSSVELDGEDLGSHFVAFDVLSVNGCDLRDEILEVRLDWLRQIDNLLSYSPSIAVQIVETYYPGRGVDFLDLAERIRAKGGEGVVLKRIDSTYQPGRPASKGDQRKIKFYNDATVRVRAVEDGARNAVAAIEIAAEGGWRDLGKVSVPPAHDRPAPGDLIEVRYLYAYPGGGLAQPVFLRARPDQIEEAAHEGQLAWKRSEEAGEDAQ